MSDRLRNALSTLDALERTGQQPSPLRPLDARAQLLATAVFLATMLSVPLARLSDLLLFALFPLVRAAQSGFAFGPILRQSLAVLPFVALIGVFNLFYDREPVLHIGRFAITDGGIAFASILVRGLLSVQALLVLVRSTGYYALCRALQRLGIPALFTAQLLLVHRYLCVLLEEALAMRQARDARSFGRRTYPLRTWATLVGQLLLRTFDRAERIGCAMLARGFTGRIPELRTHRTAWSRRDTFFLAGWSLLLIGLRLLRPAETFPILLS